MMKTIACCLLAVVLAAGCASTDEDDHRDYGLVPTRSIAFVCDRQINQGQLLPVDVIYIQRHQLPSEVISLGPDHWFDHIQRERWEEKQTLSLKGGDEKRLELNPLWLRHTRFLVVYADFKDVDAPYSQQLILDETAHKRPTVQVLPRSIVMGEPQGSWLSPCLGWF